MARNKTVRITMNEEQYEKLKKIAERAGFETNVYVLHKLGITTPAVSAQKLANIMIKNVERVVLEHKNDWTGTVASFAGSKSFWYELPVGVRLRAGNKFAKRIKSDPRFNIEVIIPENKFSPYTYKISKALV